jgi:hypothetical protein
MERYVARSSWLVLQFAPAPATVLTRRFESQRVCEETRRIKGSPSASSVLRTEPIPPADPVIVNGVGVRRDVCWFEGVASLAFIAVRSTLTFAIVVGKSSSGAPSLKLRPPPCPATSPRACAASYSLASRMSAAAQRRLTYRLFPPDVMQYRPPRGPCRPTRFHKDKVRSQRIAFEWFPRFGRGFSDSCLRRAPSSWKQYDRPMTAPFVDLSRVAGFLAGFVEMIRSACG